VSASILPRPAANCSTLFRTAQRPRQANDGGDDPSDEHPNGFVCGGSSKEPGNVGAEGVRGLNPKDDEHHAANEQS